MKMCDNLHFLILKVCVSSLQIKTINKNNYAVVNEQTVYWIKCSWITFDSLDGATCAARLCLLLPLKAQTLE